ncbi:hypothetical protein [Oceanirhabdus seepicola]|uniref:Uncharacterized protein n=1 Tax=Oceanirhabdus seepicola TaxID=2828781 RepID=A0A9J6P1G9_9CLOT|nr:hypothetical protein [Oceanirhabdus seepicola]MCM1990519.1 hypothetical protein [Oceanirhabdus seepicola]
MRDIIRCLVLIKGARYVIRGIIGLIRKDNMVFYSLVISYKIHTIPIFIGGVFVAWVMWEKLNYDKSMARVILTGIFIDMIFVTISIIYMASLNIVVIASRRFLTQISFVCIYLIVDLVVVEKLNDIR